jgi:hypothetical protein
VRGVRRSGGNGLSSGSRKEGKVEMVGKEGPVGDMPKIEGKGV